MIVNPADGTLIDPDTAPAEQLAALALELRDRERQLAQWRKTAETALLDRYTDQLQNAGRHRPVLIDGYELRFRAARRRAWDPVELEQVLTDLVDRRVLTAGPLSGLITTQTVVNGRQAQQLLDGLHGPVKAELEACFRWEAAGRPRLEITPSTTGGIT